MSQMTPHMTRMTPAPLPARHWRSRWVMDSISPSERSASCGETFIFIVFSSLFNAEHSITRIHGRQQKSFHEIMPSAKHEKGPIPLLFEEADPVLGIIRYPAQYPSSRRET